MVYMFAHTLHFMDRLKTEKLAFAKGLRQSRDIYRLLVETYLYDVVHANFTSPQYDNNISFVI